MSATVTDDAFLVKGLQLAPKTIVEPLTYSSETWSGEKMVLLPTLIDESLGRERIIAGYGKPRAGRKYGCVALAPSFAGTKDWQSYGALVATKETLNDAIETLRGGGPARTC